MNCEQARETILFYLYNELKEREQKTLREHLESCPRCICVLEKERRLLTHLNRRRSADPPYAMLAECRHKLMRTIYDQQRASTPRSSASWRQTWANSFRALSSNHWIWQTATVVGLLVTGFYFGRLTVNSTFGEGRLSGAQSASVVPLETSVGEIQSVELQPDGKRVEITLEETTHRTISGAPQDPHIRSLLISTVKNYPNSGVRLETLDALRHRIDDPEVGVALREVMLRDRNPGIRLKAFEALRVRHAEPEIRKALKQVLRYDKIPGMRIQVIDSLTKNPDDELVALLRELVESDGNHYVRLKCRRTLRQLNAPEERF